MSDPTIKQIQLVGGAKKSATRKHGAGRKGTRKFELPSASTIITKEGGGSTSPGTMTQLASTRVEPTPGAPQPVGKNSELTQTGAPLQIAGSHQPVKVVLAAAKKKGKVVLTAAKAPLPHGKTKKSKAARKVRVSMIVLSRKIHAAKTIRKKATEDSIAEIKKALEKASLIKADSKAPDVMLRQMYADYMMLKKRAL
jgi:hypothetical protein